MAIEHGKTIDKYGKKTDKEETKKELLSNISKVLDDNFSVVIVAFKPDRDTNKERITTTAAFGAVHRVAVFDLMHMVDAFMEMVDKGIYQQLDVKQQKAFDCAMKERMGIRPFDDNMYG